MGASHYQFKCGRRGGRGDGLLRNGERAVAVDLGSGLSRVGLFALHRRTIGGRNSVAGLLASWTSWDSWFVALFALAVDVIPRVTSRP